MIRDIEVLNEIIEIRKKTEFLKQPLVNDFCGSHFWSNIDKRLEQIENDIENNLKLFGVIKDR